MPDAASPAISVPVIETERLVLRGHAREDFADILAMWSEPAVVRYISGTPLAEEEAWGKFLRGFGFWQVLGYGYWLIAEKAGGRFVGEAGFGLFKRAVEPPLGEVPEMGWSLAPWAHGQGYATEAVAAAAAWGDAHLGADRTCCLISPDNTPSIRLAERVGFRETARADYKGGPAVVYHRVRGGGS